MEQRFRLALALCALVVLGWFFLFKPYQQPQNQNAPQTAQQPGTPPAASPGGNPPGASSPGGISSLPSSAIPNGSIQAIAPSKMIVVESPGVYRAKMNEMGLFSFVVLEERYKSNNQRIMTFSQGMNGAESKVLEGYQPTEMIPTYRPSLAVSFPGPNSNFEIPASAIWQRESPSSGEDCLPTSQHIDETHLSVSSSKCKVAYRLEVPNQLLIRKLFYFYPHTQRIDVEIEITNLSSQISNHHLAIGLESFQDPSKPSFFSQKIPPREMIWDYGNSIYKGSLDDLVEKKSFEHTEHDVLWFGINQQYFLQGLMLPPYNTNSNTNRKLQFFGDALGIMSSSVSFEERTVKPQEKTLYQFAYYAGPKIPERLSAVRLSSHSDDSRGLQNSVDYTLSFLAKPLLWILRKIYQVVHHWGLAIVLLTLLVKILTIYPTYRSNQSMKAMSELKPQIDQLQEKYKEDKQRLNVEIANLYKRHGVNPVGGCLPMLLQMPIYIALYSMIGNSMELYRASLITAKWIPDLTAADPFYILPLLTGAMMYLQTRLSPSSGDPQQKMMGIMMPVIFTGFSIFLPAGLTLYILTNTALGMIQQFVTNRLSKKASPKKPPSAKPKAEES